MLRDQDIVDLRVAVVFASGDEVVVSFLCVGLGGFESEWFDEVEDSVA